MDAKAAFKAMAASKQLKFWYCAKDAKGKPCFLFDPTAVPQMAIDKVLGSAKDKAQATGVMHIQDRAPYMVVEIADKKGKVLEPWRIGQAVPNDVLYRLKK